MIEWVSLSQGGRVTSVDPATNTIVTDFGNYTAAGRQRHSAAEGRPHRRDRRRRRQHRLVPDRSGDASPRSSCPNIHVIGDACIAGAHAEIGFRRERAGQGLRRRGGEPDRGQGTGDAEADRHLLQHGRARLRASRSSGIYQPEGRHVRRGRGRRHQPGRCAARGARARGRRCAMAGSRRSRWRSLARSAVDYRRRVARCWRRPALLRPVRKALRPYVVVGDAIPDSLTGAPGDAARGRAIVVNRRPAPASSATAGRFRKSRFQGDLAPDLAGAGSRWSEGQLRLRIVDASQPQSRDHHAVLLSRRRTRARRRRHCAASRSCRQSRSRMWWRFS